MAEMMTFEEQVQEQNAAIQALAAGLMALIEELHAASVIDRDGVAARLDRLRSHDGSPIPTIAALVQGIQKAEFADFNLRDRLGVIDGGKID